LRLNSPVSTHFGPSGTEALAVATALNKIISLADEGIRARLAHLQVNIDFFTKWQCGSLNLACADAMSRAGADALINQQFTVMPFDIRSFEGMFQNDVGMSVSL
jgi:hypothetical protein